MKEFSLVGADSNALGIIAYTKNAMRQTKYSEEEIKEYVKAATSGDYMFLVRLSDAQLENCNKRLAEM